MKADSLNGKLIAVVRIRGRVNVRGSITETLNRLRLKRVNNCTLVRMTDAYNGMLKKCSNHVAYGEIDSETLSKLIARGELKADAKALMDGTADMSALKESMPIRLKPPRHGFRSTKLGFGQGGDLGYMGAEINNLIKRMV